MKNNGYVVLLSILNVIRSAVLIGTAFASKEFINCYNFETNVLSDNWWVYCIVFVSLVVLGIGLHYLYLLLRTRFSTNSGGTKPSLNSFSISFRFSIIS